MNTLEAIAQRRSIRKFKTDPVQDGLVTTILQAATQAPSGKNRQPWHFVVVSKPEQRAEMVRIMRESIDRVEKMGENIGSSRWTATTMEQAPVTVFVFNSCAERSLDRPFWEDKWDIVDVQSIGGAIQTMLLAAQDVGLGTLWICDVFYAYDELCSWLGQTHQLVAAVSLGYPDEAPDARPRKPFDEVVQWL
ncbi:MAG: nitroreductase family protein [Thermoflexales bacterium]|nr:nitroreductase family protein [Thermoflexales bacterium]